MLSLIKGLPKQTEVFLVGGALRNALIYEIHQEIWPQRDYDQIVINNSSVYLEFLEKSGFRPSGANQKNKKVLAKKLIKDGADISYVDNLVFDIHIADGNTPSENLQNNTSLLINGFALNLRDILRPGWKTHIIELPGAIQAIENKQIAINNLASNIEPYTLFACLRFIGAGFKAPPKKDIDRMLTELLRIDHDKYQKNLIKLSSYVGGKDRAKNIVSDLLGDEIDIFDEALTRAKILSFGKLKT